MPRMHISNGRLWFVAVFDMKARRVLEIVPWDRWIMRTPMEKMESESDVITTAVDELDAYMQATRQLKEGADNE